MKKPADEKIDKSRRGFLKLSTVGAAGSVLPVVARPADLAPELIEAGRILEESLGKFVTLNALLTNESIPALQAYMRGEYTKPTFTDQGQLQVDDAFNQLYGLKLDLQNLIRKKITLEDLLPTGRLGKASLHLPEEYQNCLQTPKLLGAVFGETTSLEDMSASITARISHAAETIMRTVIQDLREAPAEATRNLGVAVRIASDFRYEYGIPEEIGTELNRLYEIARGKAVDAEKQSHIAELRRSEEKRLTWINKARAERNEKRLSGVREMTPCSIEQGDSLTNEETKRLRTFSPFQSGPGKSFIFSRGDASLAEVLLTVSDVHITLSDPELLKENDDGGFKMGVDYILTQTGSNRVKLLSSNRKLIDYLDSYASNPTRNDYMPVSVRERTIELG